MTEDEARGAVAAIVGPDKIAALDRFATRVRVESERQNLVAKPTLHALWQRHFLDSAQLLPLADGRTGPWVDVGTGAGFPGMVVALATDRPVALVEPRRMRADFLRAVIADEGADDRVSVVQAKVERYTGGTAGIISARAVASLSLLLQSTAHLADMNTLYLLPKGQSATTELDEAQRRFEGLFHVEQSITDPVSGIIVASRVRAKK
jgi:16S rRNA (guanine527-N7)-methyltransferase